MNKKLVASLVATMAVGATAFAANPFVDVPQDSWAYNSVVELANSGIIQGVDGVHFQGERNITRYEAAEMVAKAMLLGKLLFISWQRQRLTTARLLTWVSARMI